MKRGYDLKNSLWLVILLLGLSLIQCNVRDFLPTPPPPPPTEIVMDIEVGDLQAARSALPAGETTEVSVGVVKALGVEAPIAYQWSTTGGVITQGQGTCCIVYEAPDAPGAYEIHLTVTHGDQVSRRSLPLQVTGPTVTSDTVVSDTVAVAPTATPTPVISTPTPTPTIETPLDSAADYFARAQDFYIKRDYDRTIIDYTKAISLDYEPLSEAYFNRGYIYYVQRNYDQAVADFSQAIDLEYEPLSQPYYNRGNAYYYLGRTDQAIEDYTKAIDLNHDPLSWLYNSRGLAYRKKGAYDQAIADYTQAIELNHDPLNWPYYNRGNAYADQGAYGRAIADYTEAIRIDPGQAEAYYARGLAYKAGGETSLAVADFNKVLEIGDDYWRQEAETQLNDLATE